MKLISLSLVFSHPFYILPATGCLTDYEQQHLDGPPAHRPSLHRRQFIGNGTNFTESSIPIGVGDRFKSGTIAPRGIGLLSNITLGGGPGNIIVITPGPGTNTTVPSTPFPTLYNVGELNSGTRALAREFGLEYFEMPYKTHDNATMYGFKVPGAHSHGKSGAGYTVLLEAGIHARERGGPDHLLNFIADLLWARREKKGLTYGGSVYTVEEVKTALEAGIVVVPLVNPDGVAYDQATGSCWRKNRNRASASAGDPTSIGVDINRNFPAAWDFRKSLAPGVPVSASTVPFSEAFVGTAPLSEPEAKNIDWTMAQMPEMKWFLDIHSMAGVLLYGWGHDSNQVADKNMNILNAKYDGKRGQFPDTPQFRYGEYYPQKGLDEAMIATAYMAQAMSGVVGNPWTAQASVNLYPTSGVSTSHPMYRSIAGPGPAKKQVAHGLTLEFSNGGPTTGSCPFYPSVGTHQRNMAEVGAATMALLLNAARLK